MTSDEAAAKYKQLGLEVRYITDEPGEVYTPHRHGSVYLFTLRGSAKIKLDGNAWFSAKAGGEVHIRDNQLHEAIVDSDGWEYLFATTPEEMKQQGL
jgi:quercetin dioxygenase-like cupin family protein